MFRAVRYTWQGNKLLNLSNVSAKHWKGCSTETSFYLATIETWGYFWEKASTLKIFRKRLQMLELQVFFLKVIEYISQRVLNNACLTVTDEFKLAAFYAFSFLQHYFTGWEKLKLGIRLLCRFKVSGTTERSFMTMKAEKWALILRAFMGFEQ